MNALTSMLKGKIVLGGCEPIFMNYHKLKEPPLVNIYDNPASIEHAVIELLDNKHKLDELSARARAYVLNNHDSVKIAKEFVNCWETYS
jgi:hypothetical protein